QGEITGYVSDAFAVIDNAGDSQGLAVVALGAVEVTGLLLSISECVQAESNILGLAAQAAPKLYGLAISGNGTLVILRQFMPIPAQADGERPLTGTDACLTPVALGAVGAVKHLGGLPTEILEPSGFISPPAGVIEIPSRQRALLGIVRESEPFIPAPSEI